MHTVAHCRLVWDDHYQLAEVAIAEDRLWSTSLDLPLDLVYKCRYGYIGIQSMLFFGYITKVYLSVVPCFIWKIWKSNFVVLFVITFDWNEIWMSNLHQN